MKRLEVINQSVHPDAEVEELLRFVLDRPTVALSAAVAVRVVGPSRRSSADDFGGLAYHLGSAPGWARKRRCPFAMTLSLPSADYPYGRPEVCWHSTEWRNLHGSVGSETARAHLADVSLNGRRLGRWPVYVLNDWREGFVHLAAHEARHLVQSDRGRSFSEIDCEEWACKILGEYRAALATVAA